MAPFPPVFFEKLFAILTSNSCDQAVRAAGYTCDFMPDVGVQRGGAGEQTLSGDTVIEEGDLLWCDFGLIAMGLWTDTQHMGVRGPPLTPDRIPPRTVFVVAASLACRESILFAGSMCCGTGRRSRRPGWWRACGTPTGCRTW